MLRSFRVAFAILPVLGLFSLLNAGAQAPTTPPMMVQVPYVSLAAGNIVSGLSSTSKASACTTGYANASGTNYGDGCPANEVGVSAPFGVVVDAWGNVYFADEGHIYVRVIYAGATTVNGVANPATTMIPAANTSLSIPGTLVAGDVYALAGGYTAAITKSGSNYYCNNGSSGIVALGTNGSGCPATDSYIKGPYSPAVDSAGNVFIPDESNSLIYVVLANNTGLAAQLVTLENPSVTSPKVGYIYQIAGNGGGYVDGVTANNNGKIHNPYGVAVDSSENLYIADYTNNAVRMVNGPNNSTSGGVAAGFIHTIAGSTCTSSGCAALTGTPASNSAALGAAFVDPGAIVVDGSGNVYVADNGAGTNTIPETVRVIYAGGSNNPLANLINLETGISSPTANYVYTIAGHGNAGSSGVGAGLLATASGVALDRIRGLGLDSHGNLYIMDYGSHSELAEVNADTGYLIFLSADGEPSSTVKYTVGDYCSNNSTTGSGPTALDEYGDGCPAPQSNSSNAQGNIGIDPSGNLYYSDNGDNLIRKLTFNNSFPATTVGSPAATQNLAFLLLTGSTSDTVSSVSPVSITTQGITSGSEFTNAGTGDSCSGSTTLAGLTSSSTNTANTVCIVPVTFTPAKAGARSGAVQITGTISGNSTLLGTVYLNGIGNSAELTIDPGTSSTLGSGSEPQGVTTDSAGNAYVAYNNGTVYRTPNGGGTPVEIASGLISPRQVAIDGAGNLYVADSGSGGIYEYPGASTSSGTILATLLFHASGPFGLAVDASGNLYIANVTNVLMQPINNGQQMVLASGFEEAESVAVDASGNVYVSDGGLGEIVKLAPSNGSWTKSTVASSISPLGVAVDAAGDIYYGASGNVTEILVSSTTAVVASGFSNPVGVALDPSGNLYVADSASSSGISFIKRTAATLPAIPKERSGDAILTNAGNTSYSGGISGNSDLTASTDFTFAAGSSNGCSTPTSLSLAAGYNCDLNVTANTSTATDTVTFTGGSTLALSSAASEVVSTTTTLSVNNPSVTYGTAITGTVTVTPVSGSLNPTGTVTFSEGTPNTCTLASSTGNTSTCSFSLTGINAGSSTLTASYGGDTNDGSSSSGSKTVSITPASTTTTLSLTSGASLIEGSTFTGTITVTPSAATAESVSLYLDGGPAAATTCMLSSGSCSWSLSGVAIGNHTLTATYPGSTNYASSSTASGTSITVTAPPQAAAVATGDARTVTEPAFPAVCQQLTAAITSVNDDIPTSVDATNSNPDGARIQAALNSCSGTGQAVELSIDSTGTFNAFLTGPLSMPSNVTLLVDPGVYVYFSRNAQDYDMVPGTHTCGTVNNNSATASCQPLIDIPGTSTNVGIMGFGKLDGRGGDVLLNAIPPYQGQSWWGLATIANSGGSQQNPRFIQMDTGASNITMYKITLRNAPKFHVSTTGAVNGFTAWDVKIITPTSSRNTDGIDPGNATNFTITRSWISDGDDNVAVGAAGTTAPAQNISVTNNHFFAGHGESIGSYTSAGVSNVLFDSNMSSGNGVAGSGSAISSTGTFAGGTADSNSTGLRIKSGYDRGGVVTNIQYSNSCFQDHKAEIVFSPNYEATTGTSSPNFTNILFQNLTFLTAGTAQFTGTSNNGTVYPLGVTLDNVSFPSTYAATEFSPAPTNAALTYGPGMVSADFVSDYATFVGSNGNTVTNNSTVPRLFPPTCNFTYIAPELTGPNGLPQTIIQGQNATAVVILTPAVGGAAYPTGMVTLTDALTSNTYTAPLSGTTDTISIPLTGLAAGTHTFTASYSGDSNYTLTTGQTVYSTTASYTITVNSGSLSGTSTSLGLPVSTSVTSSYGTAITATATVTGSSPTGSVQFVVSGGGLTGSYTYATVALTSGTASASINLPYSTTAYSISAVYSGDSVNAGSTSSAASLTVGAATTQTALTVNTASAAQGNPLILTATVTSAVGTPAAAPVTFTYSTTLTGAQTTLGTATLSNGETTYFINSLPVGSYYLFASYGGSSSYGSSSSTGVPVTVTAATNIVQLSSNPIALPYTMTTIAGGSGLSIPSSGNMACTGATDKYGDGCQATAIAFTSGDDMRAVVADPFGNVYLSDISATLVRRIAPNGVITNFAGRLSGTACVPTATAGCTPTQVTLGKVRGVGTDAAGNIYIANYTGNQVFEVKVSTGLLYLVAGNGTTGTTGDGSAATSAEVNNPRGAWGDSLGNIYIAETGNNTIRVVDTAGNIHTFAGVGGTSKVPTGDGGPATAANFYNPQGVFVDPNLNVYIADGAGKIRVICVTCGTSSPLDYLLQAVSATTTLNSATNGYIYTIAGNGSAAAYAGTWPILSTSVSMAPQKLSMDNSGNLYISDSNGFVWYLDFRTGYIRAIAANGTVCTNKTDSFGDGCPATQASFGSNGGNGMGAGVDTQGNLYIADSTNGLIRKVITGLAMPSTTVSSTTSQPVLLHFAPNDTASSVTDSSSEWTYTANSCSTNADFTADCLITSNFKPAVPGLRSSRLTVSSNLGNTAYLGLTGIGSGAGATLDPAKQSSFGTGLSVAGLATDIAGNVYVSDSTSKKVLRFASSALTQGSSAVFAVLATLTAPGAVAVDPRGYVYAADTSTGQITQIAPPHAVSTLPFTFTTPAGLAVDALNNLYVSDSSAQAVYQINPITGVERNLNLGTLVTPMGLTIDPSGNLLVADPGAHAIYRYNFATGTRTTVTTTATAPTAVLTDTAGNLLIADTADILAVPASSHSSSFTAASLTPSALAIDSAGNLYTGSNGGILELIRTQGYVQYAGPSAPSQVLSMLESGNQALSPTSLGQTDTTDYGLTATASTDCTVSSGLPTALAIGGVCALTASYTPTTFLTTTDTVTVNGAVNAALSTPASVQLVLTGPATPPASSTTITSFSPASPVYPQSVMVYANVSGATPLPTGSVAFYLDGSSTPAASGTVDSSGNTSASLPGLSGGVHSVIASYTSSNGYASSSTLKVQLTVNQASQTINFPQPESTSLFATGGASGNPVTFSVVSGPGSVSGTNGATLSYTGVGTVVVAANQAGNANYSAAPTVTVSIQVVNTATLTSPTQGTTFAGSSQTFTWNPAAGATGYTLFLGSTGVGSNNLLDAHATATTVTANSLPVNGETIYARLIT
ncbi:MAG: Ig-like domain repeat protein, partial [Terracidiphilus sp.]